MVMGDHIDVFIRPTSEALVFLAYWLEGCVKATRERDTPLCMLPDRRETRGAYLTDALELDVIEHWDILLAAPAPHHVHHTVAQLAEAFRFSPTGC
jgi:hypothetical protein